MSSCSGTQEDAERTYPLKGLVRFIGDGKWRNAFADLVEDHLGSTLDLFGINVEIMQQVLGPQRSSMLWSCILEDFIASRPATELHDLMDGYIATKVDADHRACKNFMLAVHHANMSLYEVIEDSSTSSFTVLDLLHREQTITVDQDRRTENIRRGDRLAARIIPQEDGHFITTSVLPMSEEGTRRLLDEREQKVAGSRKDRPMPLKEHFGERAYPFTLTWLLENLPKSLDPAVR